jgi:phosphomannomutase
MITGPEELIQSQSGRTAIAMREKSAGESMVLVAALAAHCKANSLHLSDYLETLFAENSIIGRYDIREDVVYYNESEPDPVRLKMAKQEGEAQRDKNDLFFLGLAIAVHEERIALEQVRAILEEALPPLDFSNLEDVRFVGDGTYFKFRDKFVEVRKSGTDAKTKAYASGNNKEDCRQFAEAFGKYSGRLTASYKNAIGDGYLATIEEKARAIYRRFQRESV